MARYWNQRNLTVSGLAPGSRVFVATTTEDGEIDQHVFNERIDSDEIGITVPEGPMLLRVRKGGKEALRSFKTTFNISEDDYHITVIKVRDD